MTEHKPFTVEPNDCGTCALRRTQCVFVRPSSRDEHGQWCCEACVKHMQAAFDGDRVAQHKKTRALVLRCQATIREFRKFVWEPTSTGAARLPPKLTEVDALIKEEP